MKHKDRFRVATVQLNSVIGEVERNLERAVGYIREAAKQGANIVLFPELFLQGYCAEQLLTETAETIPGPTTDTLLRESKNNNIYIIMGMARKDSGYPHLIYNSASFIGPDGMVDYYDKIHLGTFHPYTEGVYFAPGQRTPIFQTELGPLSLQICYDVFFPELTRIFSIKGSLANLVISAGPEAFRDSWKVMLRARAIENALPTIYCNVVGIQKDFSFFGGSMVIDAAGVVTEEAKYNEEDIIFGEIDNLKTANIRQRLLLYRDRRTDLYQSITAAEYN